jgi:hypothetical protein
MTVTTERAGAANWGEPDSVAPRGTLIVIPGRGEGPELYERAGRRIAGDAYRVHAVADPAGADGPGKESWEAELAARTACPTHRGRLAGQGLRRGALFEPIPAGWESLADFGRLAVPVLGLHGTADPVSPLDAARERYRQASRAELVSIAGGVHDVLNDVTHRTVAATIVEFLERLRLGPELPPIAVSEKR